MKFLRLETVIPPWIVSHYDTSLNKIELRHDPWPPYEGYNSLDMCSDSAYSISQTVMLIIGAAYTATFQLKQKPLCGYYHMTGYIEASKSPKMDFFYDLATFPSTNWVKMTYKLTATVTETTLTIGATNTGGCGPVLDDVQLFPYMPDALVYFSFARAKRSTSTGTVSANGRAPPPGQLQPAIVKASKSAPAKFRNSGRNCDYNYCSISYCFCIIVLLDVKSTLKE